MNNAISMKKLCPFILLLLLLLTPFADADNNTSDVHPKLLLMITIDQLRGYIPWQLKDRFGKGGFRYLMERGTSFRNAHYQHSNTLTAVGHATLFTGGHTAQHGITGNNWYNRYTHQSVYCVADPSHPVIGQQKRDTDGASPQNLTSSTIGDELIAASGNRSRVFSVSIKDRGAIIPAGRKGKAFWYDPESGNFISSTYYYDDYPAWVKRWNNARKADNYISSPWALLHDVASYIHGSADDRSTERPVGALGRTFPHPASRNYSVLRYTPMADELTLDFVTALMREEKVGKGVNTDLLAISFSATDYIGHRYGPNSLEAEDNQLRLDQTLAKLFQMIDQLVGLKNTLVVLSSDHGGDAIPEHRTKLGIPAGRHAPDMLISEMNRVLKDHFSISEDLIITYLHPSIYLNTDLITTLDLEVEKVENVLAKALLKLPGISQAVTRTALLIGELPNNPISQKIQNAFHPTRSGNVLLVQEQYWFLNENISVAAVHGSPYSYDTHVPIMFAGTTILPKIVNQLVSPADIAATVANLLDIPTPSGSIGQPLIEVLATKTP